jgi:hypothetical protein
VNLIMTDSIKRLLWMWCRIILPHEGPTFSWSTINCLSKTPFMNLRLSWNVMLSNRHNCLAAESERICFFRNRWQLYLTNIIEQCVLVECHMSAGATTLYRFIHTSPFQSSSTVLYNSFSKLHILRKTSVIMTVINQRLRNSSYLLRSQN